MIYMQNGRIVIWICFNLVSQMHEARSEKIEGDARGEIRVGDVIRIPRQDQNHDSASRDFRRSRAHESPKIHLELIGVGSDHVFGCVRVVDPALVRNPQLWRRLREPLESIGGVGYGYGIGGEKAAVEGARNSGGMVRPLRREGGEERVEVVGGMIVEEDLEFEGFGRR